MSWQRQTDKPLFEDLLWSRPENKRSAGKLAIIGGQAGQFTGVSVSFAAAEQAGAGHARVLLPDSLAKLTAGLPAVEYAPSNTSGSFAKKALDQMFDLAHWADAVLLAGDFGNNSETAVTLENFVEKFDKTLVISSNAFGSLDQDTYPKLAGENVILVQDLARFQKLTAGARLEKTITSTLPAKLVAERLGDVSQNNYSSLVLNHGGFNWAVRSGNVVSTPQGREDLFRLSAYCAVWAMQHPNKLLEALATACYEAAKT